MKQVYLFIMIPPFQNAFNIEIKRSSCKKIHRYKVVYKNHTQGLSYRSNAAMSLMVFVNVVNGIDIGYAYETPSDSSLAAQNIQTHEIFFRIRLGQAAKTQEAQEESTAGPMNQ